jgi:hypothetical protein
MSPIGIQIKHLAHVIRSTPNAITAVAICALVLVVFQVGCHVQSPGGNAIESRMLGSIADEINQQQEANADAAKFVIYNHEFELNVPLRHATEMTQQEKFEFRATERVRGFQLSPYGEDHVYQIADSIIGFQEQGSDANSLLPQVIVERSESSRLWDTKHRYPVHFNAELDEARRQTVVALLTRLGVFNADEYVFVGPAFSEGLPAAEAADGWQNSRGMTNNGNLGR